MLILNEFFGLKHQIAYPYGLCFFFFFFVFATFFLNESFLLYIIWKRIGLSDSLLINPNLSLNLLITFFILNFPDFFGLINGDTISSSFSFSFSLLLSFLSFLKNYVILDVNILKEDYFLFLFGVFFFYFLINLILFLLCFSFFLCFSSNLSCLTLSDAF